MFWFESSIEQKIFFENKKISFIIKKSNIKHAQNQREHIAKFFDFVHFFFCNVDLLKNLENSKFKILSLNFVNDVNVFTYNIFTTNNCKILKKIQKICAIWTRKHDAHFASIKYEFIYLIKNAKKFNMTITIRIEKMMKKFTTSIEMLKMYINIELK